MSIIHHIHIFARIYQYIHIKKNKSAIVHQTVKKLQNLKNYSQYNRLYY